MIPLLLPDSIDRETLQSFIDMRAENKVPLTPRGLKCLLNKLARLEAQGHCPNLLLERSMMSGNKGWQDVYPDESTRAVRDSFMATHTDRKWRESFTDTHSDRSWADNVKAIR